MKNLCGLLLSACIGTALAQSPTIYVRGHVQDQSHAPVAGALVTIVGAGASDVTDNAGNFTIDQSSPSVFRPGRTVVSPHAPVVSGSMLQFYVAGTSQFVRIDVLDLRGRLVGTVVNERMTSGVYRCAPVSLVRQALPPAMYVVRVRTGSMISAHTIVQSRTVRNPFVARVSSGLSSSSAMAKSAATAGVDEIEVAADGFQLHREDLSAYIDSGLVITLAATSTTTDDDDYLDSLFRLLIRRVDTLSNAGNDAEIQAVDFSSLRDAFDGYITGKDPYSTKANVGYMVSSVLALNVNASVWEVVDSLQAYIDSVDAQSSSTSTPISGGLPKRSIVALGKSMAALAPTMVMASMAEPSFPGFITLSHVQDIAQDEIIPVLDNVVRAAQRMENSSATGLTIDVDGDTTEIDRGDIYVFDAGIRLTRAFLNILCLRDLDVFTPGTQNYTWIDSLRTMDNREFRLYTSSNDTLIETYVYDPSAAQSFAGRLMQYNLQRPGFSTIRLANHAKVKSDLLAVPELIKSAIAEIRGEVGDQTYDMIKLSDVNDMDSGLVDTRQSMIDEGVSAELADKFTSPETVADFVTELLSGPYTFDETIDSTHVIVTVDISALLDHPVQDLRTLVPAYQWLDQSDWFTWAASKPYTWETVTSQIYLDVDDTIAIDGALIDSVRPDPYGMYDRICHLNTAFNYKTELDSENTFMPIRIVDDQGDSIPFGDIDSLINAKTFFPYFTDYTIGGLLPGMTREQWIHAVYGDSLVSAR